MKYFDIKSLNSSISIIREGRITHEHRSGTAALGLSEVYFTVHRFHKTPEQIQEFTIKKPDISIEKYLEKDNSSVPHCFIEVKSLINSNFNKILDQLHDTLFVAIDDYGLMSGNFSAFMIGIKGTKIAFYVYYSFSSLLDDYGIKNYKGFIPLNYLIPEENYMDYHSNLKGPIVEEAYLLYKKRIMFNTDAERLKNLGAESISSFEHPHILDMLNDLHKHDIHEMFSFMAKHTSNIIL